MSKGEKIILVLMFLVGIALAYVIIDFIIIHRAETTKTELTTSLEKDTTI